MTLSIAVSIALIALVAITCQWIAWLAKLPAILFLLAAGIILGPVSGVLEPDKLFGDLLFPLVSYSVAIILFEGSLTLNFSEIRSQRHVVQKLVTIGAALTCIIITFASKWIFGLSWQVALLFGAITIVTGPTVIAPLLRTVRPNTQIGNVLRWEGIVIDPLGALLAVVVYQFIIVQGSGNELTQTLLAFVEIIAAGSLLGIFGGFVLAQVLRRHMLPEYLHNLATLSLLFVIFAISNELAHESGLLAVTVMGMWLANTRDVKILHIFNFKENLTILLVSGLFIILAARLQADQLLGVIAGLLLLMLVVQLIARPLSVLISSIGSQLTWRERGLIAWIAPRGIVAAAVSAVFALRLDSEQFPDAALLVPLTFGVIIGTVVLQSATSGLLARWLKVAEPEANGYLIVGANPVARAIGEVLHENEYPVMLADTSWENTREARMLGLRTFFGNIVSEYADQNLDLTGLGHLAALSPQKELNTAAVMRYRNEFGHPDLYNIRVVQSSDSDKHRAPVEHRGRTLFTEDLTYSKFASLLSKGWEIRSVSLTESYDYEDYLAARNSSSHPLFCINPAGKLQFFVDEEIELEPKPGWKVFHLIGPSEDTPSKEGNGAETPQSESNGDKRP